MNMCSLDLGMSIKVPVIDEKTGKKYVKKLALVHIIPHYSCDVNKVPT